MDQPIPSLDEFVAACDDAFGFLVRDHGFQRLAEPREYNQYSVCFRKGELGVDIYGENWGQNASCDLVRGNDDLYLTLIIPRTERKPWPKGQLAQIHEIAARLKQHASDFLNGDMQRFETALAEWKRVTKHRPYTDAMRHERELSTAVTEAGHASKLGDYEKVVRLLEPHEAALSNHQRRMLDDARARLKAG